MTMPKGWKENNQGSSGRVQLVGERRRAAGKIMMVLGIFFALFGFLATEGPVLGIFGFILSIIGVIIYASGNRYRAEVRRYLVADSYQQVAVNNRREL
jgi:membrane-bound ClpP family serine protease